MEEEKDEGWYGGWTVAAEGARPQGLERLRQVAEHKFKIIRVCNQHLLHLITI